MAVWSRSTLYTKLQEHGIMFIFLEENVKWLSLTESRKYEIFLMGLKVLLILRSQSAFTMHSYILWIYGMKVVKISTAVSLKTSLAKRCRCCVITLLFLLLQPLLQRYLLLRKTHHLTYKSLGIYISYWYF